MGETEVKVEEPEVKKDTVEETEVKVEEPEMKKDTAEEVKVSD